VILATEKTEIGRIMVQGQYRQKVSEIPSQPVKADHGGMCLHSIYMGSIK
jgi:hypothetical protein